MKMLAILLGACIAVVSRAQIPAICQASTCAADALDTDSGIPKDCDSLVVEISMSCDDLESTYGCDCSNCQCQSDPGAGDPNDPDGQGQITDRPDNTPPVVHFSTGDEPVTPNEQPGTNGPGGGVIEPTPPPPVTGGGGAPTGQGTIPPPDDPCFGNDDPSCHDQPGTLGGDGLMTALTDPNLGTRTTTTKTTATPFHLASGQTLPPPDKDTTLPFVSTSHRTHYDCDGECDKPTFAGDGFCDDSNNKCNCDWDKGDCCGTENHYIYCTYCACKDPAFRGIFGCPGGCEQDDHKGDGYCDDYNNVCSCDWDGGDCCGDQNHYGLCTECQCLDTTYVGHEPDCNGNCGAGNYIGDGFCDDKNNNCGCDWDNGDCCGNSNSYAHCDDCFCLDPNNAFHLNPDNETNYCGTPCFNQGWFGDGFCDDENNICGCDWDGGDCCGGQNAYQYCTDCTCLDPLYADAYGCPESSCSNSDHAGDAYCDDGNNNCGCDWDGGDCCGAEHFYSYCDECKCQDPGYQGEVLCSGKCEVKAWGGDGYCDDGNNVCGCDWDGGDCCDINAKTTHCTDCLCLDPNFDADTTCNVACATVAWQGDGHCDDENNHCGCDWDNGDCCGTGDATRYSFCDECRCQDPDSSLFVDADTACQGTCYHDDWTSDTHCDDGNNNCGCQWDGGDCCGPANHYNLCTKCACLDPDSKFRDCTGTCEHSGWTGDTFCDDGNNNCGCDWDAGDCCGTDNKYTTCTECACLDPYMNDATTDMPPDAQTAPPATVENDGEITPPPPPTDRPQQTLNTPPNDAVDRPQPQN